MADSSFKNPTSGGGGQALEGLFFGMAGVALLGRFIHHGAHFCSVGGVDNLSQVIEDSYLLDSFLGTNGINSTVEPIGLILEHVISHAALYGLTHPAGTLNNLMDELISLGINVHRGINANDEHGDDTHRANQL